MFTFGTSPWNAGWSNYGQGFGPVGYQKNAVGLVSLSGLACPFFVPAGQTVGLCSPLNNGTNVTYNLFVLTELLREVKLRKPLEIETALNGKQALEVVVNQNQGSYFDVIFLDLNMPILDGF